MKRLILLLLLVSLPIFLGVGCGGPPPVEEEAPVITEPVEEEPEEEPELPVEPEPEPEPIREADFMKVYFDFDKYNLVDSARAALENNADILKGKTSLVVIIEGHCDERGTEKYNLSLGDKRANSAKGYLLELGVTPGQIQETISYGESRPAVDGHNETAWAKNRRAEFKIVSQ